MTVRQNVVGLHGKGIVVCSGRRPVLIAAASARGNHLRIGWLDDQVDSNDPSHFEKGVLGGQQEAVKKLPVGFFH